ncbi:DUF523 domain-containing protein [Myxococcota bacterium]|nr:DUF523 domain-containing protein [Myxococcota bacterium]
MTASARTLVSACLLGRTCRYDGQSKPSPAVSAWLAAHGGQVVAVCPEELGGLPTPRPAAWLAGGDGAAVREGRARVVRGHDGGDVTAAFLAGAQAALARAPDATAAVLKARSPSCGCGQTWIDGRVQGGDGVFAALLRARGVPVTTDEDLPARG